MERVVDGTDVPIGDRETNDTCDAKGPIVWVPGAKALQRTIDPVVVIDMLESKDTTTTLTRDTEESRSGTTPAETPVVGRSARDTDPVVISMTEPRIVFVGLPPAPVDESDEGGTPNLLSVLRPQPRVEIGWDARSGSYRLGLTS